MGPTRVGPVSGDARRALPAVDVLAAHAGDDVAPPLARLAARRVLDDARAASTGGGGSMPGTDELIRRLTEQLAASAPPRPVWNATGVLLHTNLGRAPLDDVADGGPGGPLLGGASDIELDLATGRRGPRLRGIEDRVCALTGAEDALVVNNGCAALVLVLAALAQGGEVVVSRGQLVEIGGSFRIPEVVASGGARLHEVGTTNRTHADDYRRAVGGDTRVLLEVHPSNYVVTGFVSAVRTADLAAIAREHELSLVVDLGSGLLDERCPWLTGGPPPWLRGEPGARQTLGAGADLVTFSGDKLLGGPQAGIICGRARLVGQARRHPLARALRYDKARGGLLCRTLDAYLRGTTERDVPFWRMATAPMGALRRRAEAMAAAMPASVRPTVVDAPGATGAGSLPARALPGVAVALAPEGTTSDRLAHALRSEGVLGVVAEGTVRLHLRSLDPAGDAPVAAAVGRAIEVSRR